MRLRKQPPRSYEESFNLLESPGGSKIRSKGVVAGGSLKRKLLLMVIFVAILLVRKSLTKG